MGDGIKTKASFKIWNFTTNVFNILSVGFISISVERENKLGRRHFNVNSVEGFRKGFQKGLSTIYSEWSKDNFDNSNVIGALKKC